MKYTIIAAITLICIALLGAFSIASGTYLINDNRDYVHALDNYINTDNELSARVLLLDPAKYTCLDRILYSNTLGVMFDGDMLQKFGKTIPYICENIAMTHEQYIDQTKDQPKIFK